MSEKRTNKDAGFKPKGQTPKHSNDQLGENAAEGRLAKEYDGSKKRKKS